MLDVVLAPARALASGTDVPGRVQLRPGGSAANTARWLARLGARSTLVCAVGRDLEGRALVSALESDGVHVRATRVAGERTGRIGVLVAPGGERSFVADRAAADRLRPADLAPDAGARRGIVPRSGGWCRWRPSLRTTAPRRTGTGRHLAGLPARVEPTGGPA